MSIPSVSRRLAGFAALAGAAVLACAAGSAHADHATWDISASDGVCSVLYKIRPEHAVTAMQAYGFLADASGVSFVFSDARPNSPSGYESIPLHVTSATGARFSGDARLINSKDAEPGSAGIYVMPVAGRKDLARSVYGDFTFTYPDSTGRSISAVAHFGIRAPAIFNCLMAATGDQAGQGEEQAPDQQQPADPPAEDADLIAVGSGVAVDGLGHVLTNNHVVDGCGHMTSPTLGKGQVVAVDPASDLALLKFERRSPGAVSFRSGPYSLGEPVIVAGYPKSYLLKNGLNITVGNLSALSGPEGDRRLIQYSAPTTKGNSGGPLLDGSGRLVGLVRSALSNDIAQNMNYAVSLPIIEAFLDENGIRYSAGPDEAAMPPQAIAAKARTFTALMECRR